ncbi:phage holin family protein [Ancylobacter mangrovi]|uniref:phage holin family protein n=1 Tax=Ancylobacter mangrovi TaxID=2972472 RepID=UPI00216119C4|nr:phage holin family protein [Ancylobacter mangrovi]MCS0502372.1 phage holin family protein [Ancylobacter mangrovi]
MLRFLLSLARIEIRRTAQRAATTAFLMLFAALFLAGAILAFLIAAFVLLADRFGPAGAALILAGICLFLALVLLLVVYIRTRRRARPAGHALHGALGGAIGGMMPPQAAPGVAPTGLGPPPPGQAVPPVAPANPSSSTVIAIAAGAALLGLILGRRI